MTRSVKVADVRVSTEAEANLVNQLALAYQVAFTASDLLGEARTINDKLLTDIRVAEFRVARLGIEVAKRHLCNGVALSRRRGELINLAGRMADVGTRLDATAYAESPSGFSCDGCGNLFDQQGLANHLSGEGCPVVAVKALLDSGAFGTPADESIPGLEDVVFCEGGCGKIREEGNGAAFCPDCDEVDNSEALDAQFGGSEAEIPY